jgi:hypothetical protein
VKVARFPCPYLKGEVELSSERERHVTERHPDLLPGYYDLLVATLADPDLVRRSPRLGNARLISRWFDQIRGGKHLVAVVVSDPRPKSRHWLVTAYFARRLAGGEMEWRRD